MKTKSNNPIVQNITQHINAGTILLFSTLVALIVANSPLKSFYFELFEDTYLSINFHFWKLEKPLYYWINDGLMAIFFLLIGLEIKRELMIGELSTPKKALVPLVAAIGGMVVPALLFVAVNLHNEAFINGWAIPMATDIAFALGIMSILGKRVPIELKVLLTSLAIVDDLGAVVAIALFYTDTISIAYLLMSISCWAVMLLFGRIGVRSLWIYALFGLLFVWYPMLKSGVHATVAGVMIAFAIPIQRKFDTQSFLRSMTESLDVFKKHSEGPEAKILNHSQYGAIENMEGHFAQVSSPLQRFEHQLHSLALYVIMPIFAFANTGIDFSQINIGSVFTSDLSLGIILGLVVGKVVGIVGFIYLFKKLKIIQLPDVLRFQHLLGAGFLAGIGFTMSIFITDLAFHGDDLTATAKMAILMASLVAGITGFGILSKVKPKSA